MQQLRFEPVQVILYIGILSTCMHSVLGELEAYIMCMLGQGWG